MNGIKGNGGVMKCIKGSAQVDDIDYDVRVSGKERSYGMND